MRVLCVWVLGFFSYCAGSESNPEGVIGQDEALVVTKNVSAVPKDLINYVGLLQNQSEYCTITYLGEGLVITAGHCFKKPEECMSSSIFWLNQDGSLSKGGGCSRVLSHFVDPTGLDYAVFEVSGLVPKISPPLPDLLKIQDTLTVHTLAFRVPAQGQKPELIYQSSCNLNLFVGNTQLLAHTCSLGPGSSGAVLFINDKPIAIHLRQASGLNLAQPILNVGAIY